MLYNIHLSVEPIFTNKYATEELTIDVVLDVTKRLDGRDMQEGEFQFELVDTQNKVVANGKNLSAENGKEASVKFEEITYTQPGEYTYVIREVAGNAGGVTYSENKFEVTIKVTDNLDGTLKAEAIKYVVLETKEEIEPLFVNVYTTEETKVAIEGTKKLSGKKLLADEFTFELYKATQDFKRDGVVVAVTKNAADGSFSFGPQTFKEAGTYYFIVNESDINPISGIKYDKTVYGIAVEVSDDGKGSLTADTTIVNTLDNETVSEIEFVNTFEAPPKTGDNKQLGLWTAILALCATGFIGLDFMRKKEEEYAND